MLINRRKGTKQQGRWETKKCPWLPSRMNRAATGAAGGLRRCVLFVYNDPQLHGAVTAAGPEFDLDTLSIHSEPSSAAALPATGLPPRAGRAAGTPYPNMGITSYTVTLPPPSLALPLLPSWPAPLAAMSSAWAEIRSALAALLQHSSLVAPSLAAALMQFRALANAGHAAQRGREGRAHEVSRSYLPRSAPGAG